MRMLLTNDELPATDSHGLLSSEPPEHQHRQVDGTHDGGRLQKGEETAVNRVSRLHILTVGVIVCLATAAFAQSEKVDLRMVPKPGQTVRLTMTQDMDMDMSFDGAAALPGLAPMKMATKTTMTMTQKTGALKPTARWRPRLPTIRSRRTRR